MRVLNTTLSDKGIYLCGKSVCEEPFDYHESRGAIVMWFERLLYDLIYFNLRFNSHIFRFPSNSVMYLVGKLYMFDVSWRRR